MSFYLSADVSCCRRPRQYCRHCRKLCRRRRLFCRQRRQQLTSAGE